MKIFLIIILLSVSSFAQLKSPIAVDENGNLDNVKIQRILMEHYNYLQPKKHKTFSTVPEVKNINEGEIVFFSSSTKACSMYVLINGTTFSVNLSP